jgi:hypothetical protein
LPYPRRAAEKKAELTGSVELNCAFCLAYIGLVKESLLHSETRKGARRLQTFAF